ncbi:tyrosine-type recombinase/integrase [Exiguobacterium sp. s162]|uniref:tyrosine-type recombinase/integrase n=1 Tax=Exiguobacterium sp. s162 TaxID=2751276 RepID=UPI001BE9AA56|nr:tyrosine-type recombinase/integrase [Exiguobacterium sp. s162]
MAIGSHKDRKKKKGIYYFEFQYLGERRKKSGFHTKAEAARAEQLEREKIRKMKNGEYEIEDPFSTRIQEWHDSRRNIQASTRSVYQYNLNNHIKKFFKDKRINSIQPIDVKRFIDSLHDEGLSESTIKKNYNILNKFFNDMLKLKLLNDNPCFGIEKPREINKKIEVFTKEELLQFLNYAETQTRYAFAFKLAAYTGMRRGELLALEWSDIDFEKKTIRINKRIVKGDSETKERVVEGTKSSSGRTLKFSEELALELIKHKQIQQLEKESNHLYQDSNLVICTVSGTHVSVDNLSRQFRKTLNSSPIDKKLGFHSLRHTNATMLLLTNTPMKVVSDRLGHAGIQITMDTYAHLLPSMDSDAAERLELLLKSPHENS